MCLLLFQLVLKVVNKIHINMTQFYSQSLRCSFIWQSINSHSCNSTCCSEFSINGNLVPGFQDFPQSKEISKEWANCRRTKVLQDFPIPCCAEEAGGLFWVFSEVELTRKWPIRHNSHNRANISQQSLNYSIRPHDLFGVSLFFPLYLKNHSTFPTELSQFFV